MPGLSACQPVSRHLRRIYGHQRSGDGVAEVGGDDLLELLEDFLLILGSNADSGVADGYLNASVLRHCRDFDPPTFGRELDRVRQEVQDDLSNLLRWSDPES